MSRDTSTTNGNGAVSTGEVPELTGFVRPTDEAQAVPRPAEIETFYLELEYEAAEEEQLHAFRTKGEHDAREPDKAAAALKHEAVKAASASDTKHAYATALRKRLELAEKVLGPFSRRPTDAKPLKWLRWALLLGGDIVGIAGAALLLGELPVNAFMQAISAAASAVTLGAVGREVRNGTSARFRQKEAPDSLSDEEEPYASWFAGPNTGESLVRIIVLVCATGAILIAGGIFVLRGAAQGLGPAIAFGCLALALGLASFYNSFDTADDVAEHLDSRAAGVKKAERLAELARKDQTINRQAEAEAEAISIRSENEAAGKTTAAAVRREEYASLGNSPGVAGNGFGPSAPRRENGGSENGAATSQEGE